MVLKLARTIVAVAALAGWASPALAQIGVSPARVELELGPVATTESIRLFNFGAEPAEVRVAAHNWDLDEANEVRVQPPDEQSLDGWLVIQPLQFAVAPGASQVVRFSVRPRVEPAPGEHRAMIFFEQVAGGGQTAGVEMLFRLGVAVYGYTGDVSRVGKLERISVDETAAGLAISSHGTAHVRLSGSFAVWPAGDDALASAGEELPREPLRAGALPSTPVLPGSSRVCRLPFERPLPPGDYVLELDGALGDEALVRAVPFSVRGRTDLALAPTE